LENEIIVEQSIFVILQLLLLLLHFIIYNHLNCFLKPWRRKKNTQRDPDRIWLAKPNRHQRQGDRGGITKRRKTQFHDSCEMWCQKIGKVILATPRTLAAFPSPLFALLLSLYTSVLWVLVFPLSSLLFSQKEI